MAQSFSRSSHSSSLPWYHEGVYFECTGCGQCCTGGPGAVWVSDEEMARLAVFLNISVEEFKERYTRLIDQRPSLKEVGQDFDCIFLRDKSRCAVYPVRPLQCQTFPFWPGVMASSNHWQEAGVLCEGINKPGAPRISCEQIEEQLGRH